MQAIIEIHNALPNSNIIVRNVTPFNINRAWLDEVGAVLSQEEINNIVENAIMTEFMDVYPSIIAGIQDREQQELEMNDPQAGPAIEHPTLTKEQYKNWPSKRFKKADILENYCQDSCVICTDKFKSNNKIPILSCGHSFHWKCLGTWVTRTHSICPICKTPLQVVTEKEID